MKPITLTIELFLLTLPSFIEGFSSKLLLNLMEVKRKLQKVITFKLKTTQ